MGKVYESLKEAVQGSRQRSKDNPDPLIRVDHNHASRLTKEIGELEKVIVQKMAGLKAALKQGEEVVEKETEHTEQVVQTLTQNITTLEAKLQQTEDAIHRKESASQKMEENLSAEIYRLREELKKKNETLHNRDSEINNLKSKVDVLVRQAGELESSINRAKIEAETEAKRTGKLTETSNTKIAALEVQIRDLNGVVRDKEATIKALEQNLTARSQEFQNQLRNKETLLVARDAEINDLKSQLQLLTRGVKEMSSFFKQAEALAAAEGQNGTPAIVGEQMSPAEEKPASAEKKNPAVTVSATETAQQSVPPSFFDRVIDELTQIMGPLAPMIVRDHVAALGESMEKFPDSRIRELLMILSNEILNENLKNRFRVWSERVHGDHLAGR